VEAEGEIINANLSEENLRWFLAHNWVHNGGFGVPKTPQAWIPVECEKAYVWLYVDDMTHPRSARFYPLTPQDEHPPCENYIYITAASYLYTFLQNKKKSHLKDVLQFEESDRTSWYSHFLHDGEYAWGALYAQSNLCHGSEYQYLSYQCVDGSVLYITPDGPTLEQPGALIAEHGAHVTLSRTTDLRTVPLNQCHRA
jgi:hypothetical protein